VNSVWLCDNRSCFGHGVSNYTVSDAVTGPAFYGLGWRDLSPVFDETELIGKLTAQLEDS